MAGKRALKSYLAVLQTLSDGPKTKRDLKVACGYDAVREYPALDALLQDMRVAGVIECNGKTWGLSRDREVCPACQGRGFQDKGTA
jgi:hypothetical protein